MLKMERVENAFLAPRSEINIEIAHVYWDGSGFGERFIEEYNKSIQTIQDLCIIRGVNRFSISILIDDKRINFADKFSWLQYNMNRFSKLFESIDYLVMESDLKNYMSMMYKLVEYRQRRSIESSVERYIRAKKTPACSHDIAVWHLMRSGAFGAINLPVYRIVNTDNRAERLLPSFCASRIASVLNQSDREHEETAEAEILRYISSDHFSWRNVERYYYY